MGNVALRLRADGHRVRVARDGPCGLRTARARLPDLVLLDVELPGFDGLELLARLRRAPGGARLPVIVLSNCCDPGVADRGRELGVLGHLVKSLTTPAALAATIRRLVPPRCPT